jgi:hypothetical protein
MTPIANAVRHGHGSGSGKAPPRNATVATALLSDLVERGLDREQGILFVLDGAKALTRAVRSVFGEVPVHRCIRHEERNVLDHFAERDRPAVPAAPRDPLTRLARTRPTPPCRVLPRLDTPALVTAGGVRAELFAFLAGGLGFSGRDGVRRLYQDPRQEKHPERQHDEALP